MLKLNLQYFGHLMWTTGSFEKTLMLGKIEGRRGWNGWMSPPTQWTWVWVSSSSWWWTGRPNVLQSMGSQLDMTEWLNWYLYLLFFRFFLHIGYYRGLIRVPCAIDKAVVHVIRLTSFLWLWFVCLPSDVSPNTYCLTWVSLTLDVGYLFMTAAWISKCSCWF